ncbi:hypothetical protein R1flu_026790 [Riccia fluitans]|uniref:Uncharacterized protein n=1 Tax=Riccia fluitans TaxID=41844 RepID=A0ABD1XGY8_9MARC
MSGGSHSPNLGLLDQEASMQNIDRLVEALEMEARESETSKRRKLFLDEPSSSALQVYQPLDLEEPSSLALQVYQPLEHLIVPSFPKFGIARKELLVLFRDEVVPYVNTQRLKIDGIVKISSGIFEPTRSSIGTTSKYIMDLSTTSLRKLVDFPIMGECRRIVPPSEVEAKFLKRTGRKYKKDAWQDIAHLFGFSLTHSQPRSEGWLVDDFKKFSLEDHPDGYAFDMQAIMRIVRVDFLAKQAIARHEHEPLLLEARNAFTNTRAEWDNENGELVREREALKKELNKAKEMAIEAKEMAAEAEQRMEVV